MNQRMRDLLPSTKIVIAAVAAGIINIAVTQNLDWRSAAIAFGTGVAGYLGIDLNPAGSTRKRLRGELEAQVRADYIAELEAGKAAE